MIEFAALRLFLALIATTGAAAPADEAGIYFQRDDARPWQNCYSIPQQEALLRARAGRFKDAGLIALLGAEASGERIVVSHGDPARPQSLVLERCPFTENERSVQLQCEVTVQTMRHRGELDSLSHYPEIEKEWRRKDPSVSLIDCRDGSVSPVRNVWRQTFALADYKLIARINAQGHRLIARTALGRISEGGSLHPHQGWSAAMGFNFMENRMQMEICDAAVEEISVPRFRQLWLNTRNGGWCPWGLEIVSLSCPGQARVDGSTSFSRLRLNTVEPEVRSYCGAKAP